MARRSMTSPGKHRKDQEQLSHEVADEFAGRYYATPKPAAKNIENYVAFYKNKVTIS